MEPGRKSINLKKLKNTNTNTNTNTNEQRRRRVNKLEVQTDVRRWRAHIEAQRKAWLRRNICQ